MNACPNVWVDMSSRDHLRYGNNDPIVNDKGQLLPEWRKFVMKFQNRIMLGSDPYYYESMFTWDAANTGWDHVSEVLAFHRRWLNELPTNVRQKIALGNAMRFYRLSGDGQLRSH